MIHIDTSSRSEQRKFGLVMAAAIVVLGTLRWAFHGFAGFPMYWYSVAAVFLVLGLVAPPVLKPVFVLWMKLAVVLNWIMTRVFLGFAFYVLITPTRVCLRLFGDDPLKRAWKAPGESYWEEPEEQPQDLERCRQQF